MGDWLREEDLHFRPRRYERRELLLLYPVVKQNPTRPAKSAPGWLTPNQIETGHAHNCKTVTGETWG